MTWLLILGTAVAFGLGFALAFVRARRRLRARMQAAMEAEVARQVQGLVLKELQQGKGRERLQQNILRAAEQQSGTVDNSNGAER